MAASPQRPPSADRSALFSQAWEAWQRQRPRLLEREPGRWVAFYGPTRLAVVGSQPAAFEACRRAGLDPDDCLIDVVEPDLGELELGPDGPDLSQPVG